MAERVLFCLTVLSCSFSDGLINIDYDRVYLYVKWYELQEQVGLDFGAIVRYNGTG